MKEEFSEGNERREKSWNPTTHNQNFEMNGRKGLDVLFIKTKQLDDKEMGKKISVGSLVMSVGSIPFLLFYKTPLFYQLDLVIIANCMIILI